MFEVPSSTSMWACYVYFWMTISEWSATKCCNKNQGQICSTSYSRVTCTISFDLWTLKAKYNIFFKVVNFINNNGSPSMWLLKGEMGWLSNYGNLIIVILILVGQFRVKACYGGTF